MQAITLFRIIKVEVAQISEKVRQNEAVTLI